MLDITITSKTIKEARRKANLTQEQLAEMLFVTKQAVSNWERGENLPDEDVQRIWKKSLVSSFAKKV